MTRTVQCEAQYIEESQGMHIVFRGNPYRVVASRDANDGTGRWVVRIEGRRRGETIRHELIVPPGQTFPTFYN